MAFSFYRANAWWLGTGLAFTFASTFGQTSFISLFAGELRAVHDLSNGEWGALYTAATLTSALCLFQFGGLADTVPLRRLALIVLSLYTLAALTMALSAHVLMVLVAVFVLRFCGQGMMTHLAMTAMARWFRANRGRAIAIAVLGYPVGEALMPPLFVPFIAAAGWRMPWLAVAAVLALLALPALLTLLARDRVPQGEGGGADATGMGGRHWTRREVMRHWSLWALLPATLAPPFIGTCAFFHLVHVSQVRGYDLTTMTLAFPLYAAISVATSLIVGSVVDRLGPTRVLPVFLLPITAGIAVLSIPGGVWVWFATLGTTALSQGAAVTLLGALWPTLYGTAHIGSVKSMGTAAMVVSTAAGPGVTGVLIDLGIPFPDQGLYLAAYCGAITVLLVIVAPQLGRRVVLPEPAVRSA